MAHQSPFENIVFAGGGCRCFWQAGFYDTAAPALGIRPSRVAAVSAGAALACMIMGSNPAAVLAYFKEATARNKKNFYPTRLVRGGAFPHYQMYRDTILNAIDGDALARIRRGPEILVLMARPPRFLGPRSGTMVGILTYSIEKALRYPVHSAAARRLGYRAEVADARAAATPEDLAELILQSSCTPPFVPIMKRDGHPVLDGGLVDNVPVSILGAPRGETLLLLTRTYPAEKIPRVAGRTYVQPSAPIPISKWDYTSPELLQQTFDLGRRDGEAFAALKKRDR